MQHGEQRFIKETGRSGTAEVFPIKRNSARSFEITSNTSPATEPSGSPVVVVVVVVVARYV